MLVGGTSVKEAEGGSSPWGCGGHTSHEDDPASVSTGTEVHVIHFNKIEMGLLTGKRQTIQTSLSLIFLSKSYDHSTYPPLFFV